MHLKSLFGVVLTLLIATASFAAPQENKSQTLTRDLNQGTTLRTEMSLNVYRQEPYQAEYTEEVPYQAEEDYYVDVPYETTETYYESVPYTERVPYTDYEDYYENEYVCKNVTRYRQECHNENVCAPGGRTCQPVTECGINSRGERVCKTREECRDNGPRECRDVPKCQQVPYSDRECGYQSVRKSRSVTRYRDEVRHRQEQRTRRVTKYRQEVRTRTVTKYRDESRCCVTRYRDVFDHQFTQPVTVIFPAEATLLAGEMENVLVALIGTEANPEVQIRVKSNVFSYAIAETRLEGRDRVFILKITPKWTQANAGTATVKGLNLSFQRGQGKVIFSDTVASSRMVSAYALEIRDQQSQTLVFEQQLQGNEAKNFEILIPNLVREGKYNVTLRVLRQGINVEAGSLSFAQTTTYEQKELDQDEVQNLKNQSLVELLGIEGQGADRLVIVRDQTPALEEVKTTYKLVVWKKLSNGKIEWLGEKPFARENLVKVGDNQGISLKAIGVNPPAEQRLYLDLVVNRTSSQYLGNEKVQFIVSKTF